MLPTHKPPAFLYVNTLGHGETGICAKICIGNTAMNIASTFTSAVNIFKLFLTFGVIDSVTFEELFQNDEDVAVLEGIFIQNFYKKGNWFHLIGSNIIIERSILFLKNAARSVI